MSDPLRDQALARIEQVNKRLIALQEHGVECGALISQLSFAHDLIEQRQYDEVEALCDELAGAVAELAKGHSDASGLAKAVRVQPSGKYYQQEALADQIRSVLEAGLLDKVMRKQGDDGQGRPKAVQTNMKDLVDQVGQAVATVLEANAARRSDSETQRLRRVMQEALADRRPGLDAEQVEQMLDRAMARHDARVESELGALQERLAALQEQLDAKATAAPQEGVTSRIQRAVGRSIEEHALPDAEQIGSNIAASVQQAFRAFKQEGGDGLTKRIGRAVGEAVAQQRSGDSALEERIAAAVQRHLDQMPAPVQLDGFCEEVVAGVAAVVGDLSGVGMTSRINRAVESALADQMPTGTFDLTERVQSALDQQPTPGQDLSSKIRRAVSDGLAQHGFASPHEDISELVDDAIERAGSTIPGFRPEAFGSELRDLLQQQLGAIEDHLQGAFNQTLESRSAQLEGKLATIIERLSELPLAAGGDIGPEVQSEVHRQVEEALDVGALRSAARDASLMPNRGGLRAVIASGVQRAMIESAIFEIAPDELDRCDNPKHLVDAKVADAIEDLIDGMVGGIGQRLTNRFTNHVTRRILNGGTQTQTGPGASSAALEQEPVMDDTHTDDDRHAETGEEYSPTSEEDDSVLTHSLKVHDLVSELDQSAASDLPAPAAETDIDDELSTRFEVCDESGEPLSDEVVEAMISNAGGDDEIDPMAADPSTQIEKEDEPAPAVQTASDADEPVPAVDDEDASAMIAAMLRELDGEVAMPPEMADEAASADNAIAREVQSQPSQAKALARDLLYELTEASIPESARQEREKETQVDDEDDGQRTDEGLETSELINEALRRGEARFTKPYGGDEQERELVAGDAVADASMDADFDEQPRQPTTDFPARHVTTNRVRTGRRGTAVSMSPGPATSVADRQSVRELIRDELSHRAAVQPQVVQQMLPPAELKAELKRHLPALLADDDIKQHLFAVVAYEMIVNPGMLHELAGIKHFLRSEMRQLLAEMEATTQPETQ